MSFILLLFLTFAICLLISITLVWSSQFAYWGMMKDNNDKDMRMNRPSSMTNSADDAASIINNNNGTTVIINSNDTSITPMGKLRRDWTSHHPPFSYYGKLIQKSQSNCSLKQADFYLDNSFGIGSHLSLWSQAVCNAWQVGARVRTLSEATTWLWLDQESCLPQYANSSPLLCYLPKAEANCPNNNVHHTPLNVTDPRDQRKRCDVLKKGNESLIQEFRTASTEFLFQKVSSVVVEEAKRQAGILFARNGGIAPKDLITVHIRWGDKFWEMDLASIDEYLVAISTLLHKRQGHNRTANIYLATEDPKAVKEFLSKIPAGWNIYIDVTVRELSQYRPNKGNRASHATKNSRGRAGLVAFGSLLIALEARDYVLTTKSNWSRLMNQLRLSFLEARYPHTTNMIDLRPGIW